jgi:hypothetical protein
MLNAELSPEDCILIIGNMFKEQKLHAANTFIMDDQTEEVFVRGILKVLQYFPRFLFATSGVANAGLDCAAVRSVLRDGFPPSLQDLIQEMGRCGRWDGALPSTDTYTIVVCFESLVSLLFRIYVVPVLEKKNKEKEKEKQRKAQLENDATPETTGAPTGTDAADANEDSLVLENRELQQRLYSNLLQVVGVLFLHPGWCIHQKLEYAMLNPFKNEAETIHDWPSCGNDCWHCSMNATTRNIVVNRKDTTRALVHIFLLSNMEKEKFSLYKGNIVKTIVNYNVPSAAGPITFGELAFSSINKRDHPPKVKILLLQLFACRLVVPDFDNTTNILRFQLALDMQAENPILLYDVTKWRGIDCSEDNA